MICVHHACDRPVSDADSSDIERIFCYQHAQLTIDVEYERQLCGEPSELLTPHPQAWRIA